MVTFKLPPRATREEAESYVQEAVTNWHGSLEPTFNNGSELIYGDPMFDLDINSVNTRLVRSYNKKGSQELEVKK